ncbi:Protein-tyrosine-phosphatase [Heracleum sosnowskyi]|uniref:protein-tyrosine-phosphatase n=1 Tax=Heracleum sosnowskyi TaxID=360622 RepID=A0AAD8I5U9_9APIA|nr:Protein-tyrosine-phosphatase [Heracleum sosnowskyi]
MDDKMIVYIWDMDETLILLKSLINGTYAECFDGLKDVQRGVQIGKTWENYILDVCDQSFFYQQIENCNQPFLDAFNHFDDGRDLSHYNFSTDEFGPLADDVNKTKLAYRHRLIAHNYKKGLRSILDQNMTTSWESLYEETDFFTNKWHSSARDCLEQCSGTRSQHVNLLVTSGSLIPSLVKCLLFQLDDLISYENVYSSWEVGKLQCFTWIKERFSGQNIQFCVIGDGWEECEAAQSMKWPFVQVDPRPGSPHRFPGLNVSTLGNYLAVIYDQTNKETDETASQNSSNNL